MVHLGSQYMPQPPRDADMSKVYMYVVARDFGFAPNPFHGVCTLATCKPKIRRVAKAGDWVIGMGGNDLRAIGHCIYLMRVTGTMSFQEYWDSTAFYAKRPVRNGSRKMMVGDNIYHKLHPDDQWTQEDSHHSQSDGSPEWWNVENDTQTDRILYSRRFVYFGKSAMMIPKDVLAEIGYQNGRNHRTFLFSQCETLLRWIESLPGTLWNTVVDDPFQFNISGSRYSKQEDRIV